MLKFTSTNAIVYLLIAVIVPVATLSILGLVYLANQAILIPVLLLWFAVSAIAYAALIIWPARKKQKIPRVANETQNNSENSMASLPTQLEPQSDWTDKDLQIWLAGCQTVQQQLELQPDWEALPDIFLNLLSEVSSHYNASTSNKETHSSSLQYRFTVPELLLVLAITSQRYREIVLAHIPFAERVNVSALLSLYEHQSTIRQSYTWLNRARRLIRLSNPVAAAIGELRDQFTDRIFNQLSVNVQQDLKRLLLQEVIQVAIELYSGRLKSSPEELRHYQSSSFKQDAVNVPEAIEPLRIALVGQSSAGKSSLINAFSKHLAAEVDTLPTTSKGQTHVIELAQGVAVHMIDTVGLDGSEERMETTAANAIDADLILFVARANQPARSPDQQLFSYVTNYFKNKPARRQPPVMLVLTHIGLLSPRAEWTPPYDLGGQDQKSKQISMALHSSIEQIGFPSDTPAVPICLSSTKENYNVEALAAQIMQLQDSAVLAQWNRRRVEAGDLSITWTERWSQVKNLGQVAGKLITRKL